MVLIDTHTHLFSKEFDEDIDTVIQQAKSQGVSKFLLPNIDESTIDSMQNLSKLYPGECYSMMGIHPCSITKDYKNQIKQVRDWHNKEKFIAVGEIGIDLFWDKTLLKEQLEAFRLQVELAKELKLPIVIHVRDSFDETFEIIDELNDENLTGIFHCFTGTIDQAQKIINYNGFKLGIGGVVTFKNSGLDKVVKKIALDHLVLETDSPYLAPAPFRGKRNESKYVLNIADKLSDIHEISIEKVAEITTKNALEIFNLNE